MTTGFGGFPNPIVAAAQFARNNLPAFKTVERNLTMPRTTTLTSIRSSGPATIDARTKPVSYISFDATVGRNSRFHNLTQAQQEELGGVEYRVRDYRGMSMFCAESFCSAGVKAASQDRGGLLAAQSTSRSNYCGSLVGWRFQIRPSLHESCGKREAHVVYVF